MDLILIGIILSIIINLVLLIGVRNLLKQNEQLEDNLISVVANIREKVSSALDDMRVIDYKQAFEKDDEVGVTFNKLKEIVENLDNEL